MPSSYSLPSIYNRSVVISDLYRSLYISFQPECLHVLLVHCNLFSLVFQPIRFSQCSLFLFSNGVYSISFIFVVFFSRNCSTSQGSLVSLVCLRSNFVLPIPPPFPSGAIQDLGTRSSIVVECCNAPRPTLQKASSYFVVVVCFIGLLHSSSQHCIGTLLPSLFSNLHPLVVAAFPPCFR